MNRIEANDASKAICIAMLNYGAAVQDAFNHCDSKAEYLANADLAAELKTIPEVEFGNYENVIIPEGDLKPFRDSLNMQAKVVMQFPIKISDFSNYEVRYTINGGDEITLSAETDITTTVAGSTTFKVPNIAITALNFRSEYRISIYDKTTGEKVYGDIVCSVADIAAKYENDPVYHNVVATMLAYGDAVTALYGN